MQRFKKIKKLGEGGQGVVSKYEVLDANFCNHLAEQPKYVAIKKIRIGSGSTEGLSKEALREIKILTELNNENVLSILDTFVHRGSIHVVLPLMKTDLFSIIYDRSIVLQPQHVKVFLMQILKGVEHLHDMYILHRDLKPSNCLIGYDDIVRISDFGLAREYGSLNRLSPQACTVWYRAPELLFGSNSYSSGMDMWSIGCIFAELILRKPLFGANEEIELVGRICTVLGTPNTKIWPNSHMLPKVFQYAESAPMDLLQIFPPYTTKNTLDLLQEIVNWNPLKRLSASEALQHPYFKEEPLPCAVNELPIFHYEKFVEEAL